MKIGKLILALAAVMATCGASMQAQFLAMEPAPRFRFGVPIPQVAGKGVKNAVLIEYATWQSDSLRFTGNLVFRPEKPENEKVMFEYAEDGKVLSGSKIFPYGDHINADWEQSWSYDSLGRLRSLHAHYLSKDDGSYVYPDSTAFSYDDLGRLTEVLELKNYRYTGSRLTVESGARTRYTYTSGTRSAAREKCRLIQPRSQGWEGDQVAGCRTDSIDFDEEGRIVQVRWIQEAFKEPGKDFPPEVRYTYDEKGRMTETREYSFGREILLRVYTYDAMERLESETVTETQVHNGNPHRLIFGYRADGLPDRIVSRGQGAGGIKFDYKVMYEFYE